MSAAKPGKFDLNDLVWALDRGTLYISKVLKRQYYNEKYQYFIHYQGWDKKHDTWMDEDSLVGQFDAAGKLKLEAKAKGETVIEEKKTTGAKRGRKSKVEIAANAAGSSKEVAETEVKEESSSSSSSSSKRGRRNQSASESSSSSSSSSNATDEAVKEEAVAETDAPPLKKRRNDKKVIISPEELLKINKERKKLAHHDLTDENCDDFTHKLTLPLVLKQFLVDEWGLITGDSKRLITLPRTITATMLVNEYLEHMESKLDKLQFSLYKDQFEGLLVYFNRSLPFLLLYRHEREQYDCLVATLGLDLNPADIYGGEHLIRLFVRMPRLLTGVIIPTTDMNDILSKYRDFIEFIKKNKVGCCHRHCHQVPIIL